MIIPVNIAAKRAAMVGNHKIVCGNSDYTIEFSFDSEWDEIGLKTARFVYVRDGEVRHQDVVFAGSTVAVPVLANIWEVRVGVFSGDLRTTTPAHIPCEQSVRCGTGAPEDPTPSQYDQIMKLLAGVITEESDPTVPDWAKQPEPPKYTASDVGARPETWMPSASDVGARPETWMPSASDVGALPAGTKIPAKTSDIENDSGYITAAVNALLHYYLKSETYSQTEVDGFISGLENRLNAIADSDDKTLDQLSEIVAYIKSNKSLIDSITTSKVSVADIIDNLTTGAANKPLSAKQGAVLKSLIDTLSTEIPSKTSDLQNDSRFITRSEAEGMSADAVRYNPQALTDEQKAQARENIDAVGYDPDIHAEYFQITDDGVISLKPEYRGAVQTSVSTFTDAISDNGLENVGSKNNQLPDHLIIPETVNDITVNSLAAGMFLHNEGIRRLTIPRFITVIPDRWAYTATYLHQLYGTDNVQSIGLACFYCTQLERVSFPNLTTLGTYAFAVCPFLKYIDIGKISTISTLAFSCCEMLTSIKGGENVTKIDANAFEKTKNINNMPFLSKVTSIGNGAFLGSRMHYDWSSLTNCTFGTLATAKQLNPTDIWSNCTITECENPMPTLLAQHDVRWADRQIGTSGKYYGSNGCLLLAMLHIYCGLHNLTFTTAFELEEYITDLYPNFLNNFSPSGSNAKKQCESLGLKAESYSTIDQTVLQTLYDSLAAGKYAIVSVPTNYSKSAWHSTVLYGIKSNGELLVADSDPSFYAAGASEKAIKFAIRYQNYIPTNRANGLTIVSL